MRYLSFPSHQADWLAEHAVELSGNPQVLDVARQWVRKGDRGLVHLRASASDPSPACFRPAPKKANHTSGTIASVLASRRCPDCMNQALSTAITRRAPGAELTLSVVVRAQAALASAREATSTRALMQARTEMESLLPQCERGEHDPGIPSTLAAAAGRTRVELTTELTRVNERLRESGSVIHEEAVAELMSVYGRREWPVWAGAERAGVLLGRPCWGSGSTTSMAGNVQAWTRLVADGRPAHERVEESVEHLLAGGLTAVEQLSALPATALAAQLAAAGPDDDALTAARWAWQQEAAIAAREVVDGWEARLALVSGWTNQVRVVVAGSTYAPTLVVAAVESGQVSGQTHGAHWKAAADVTRATAEALLHLWATGASGTPSPAPLVCIVDADVPLPVLETALTLWDPRGDGEYGQFADALQAAHALCLPAPTALPVAPGTHTQVPAIARAVRVARPGSSPTAAGTPPDRAALH